MNLDMRITEHSADEGLRRMQEALDTVIEIRGPQDYLVGEPRICFGLA